MSTVTDVDMKIMVGHLREVECDHIEHGQPGVHHNGYATWYVTMRCFNCTWTWDVFPVCQPYVDYCHSGGFLICKECRCVVPGIWMLKLVTPIT